MASRECCQPPCKRQRRTNEEEPGSSWYQKSSYLATTNTNNKRIKYEKGFSDLPNEILLEIFSYLSTKDLTTAIPNVCSRWNIVHNDASLYTILTFDKTFPDDTAGAKKLIKMSPRLKHLKLRDRVDASEILRHVSILCRKLKSLKLYNCQGTPRRQSISAVSLRHILYKCNTIEHLKLRRTFCIRDTFYNSIGTQLPNLKTICLEPCRYIRKDALENIADNCGQLEELRIFKEKNRDRFCQSTDELIGKICEKHKETLTVLKMNGLLWTDGAMEAISKCTKLKKLSLQNLKQITNNGALKISNLNNLDSLDLSKCDLVTANLWGHLFTMPSLKNLRRLSWLSCTSVNNGVLQVVAPHLESLEQLWARKCSVTNDSNSHHLLAMLPPNCNLVY